MSVLIRGMKMPASCYDCDLCFESMDSERNVYWTCPVLNKDVGKYERREDCPLGDVPVPHGRLIDADAAAAIIQPPSSTDEENACTFATVKALMHHLLNNAPTVIDAEDGER